MNPSREKLDHKLAELETASGISEYEIEEELRALRVPESQDTACQEWQYEMLAFSFRENQANTPNGWGTYFGPVAIYKNDDGTIVHNPSLQHIARETLSYWHRRAKQTHNPVLRARYAGVLWDLSEAAANEKASHEFARLHCCALLDIANKQLHPVEVDIVRKLARALSVAISLNDKHLIGEAKQTIIRYERDVGIDSKPGLWGFSFDLLVGNRKALTTATEELDIITTLEERLERLRDGDPWRCEKAAERLARYYRGKGRNADCSRVILKLGDVFETAARSAAPLAASSWLEHIYLIYKQFNLPKDADRVAHTMKEVGPKVLGEMKTFSEQMVIPPEKFDSYVDAMTQGTLEEVLARIAVKYIERREATEKQLDDLSRKAPLSFLFTKQLLDQQGRMIASIGSLREDPDGHVVNQMAQNMAISSIFVKAVLDRTLIKFAISVNSLMEHLSQSPLFESKQMNFLSEAVAAYLNGSFSIAIHLFVPQIEAAIRKLVEFTGGPVLKPREGGGFHLIALDEMLRTKQVEEALGTDTPLYFRVLLTDQRGWNIRNEVCHGILPHENANRNVADRLLHVLLVLSLLRSTETPSPNMH